MMVLFDATTLLLLLSPNVPPPCDPTTGEAVTHAKERIDHLVKLLEEAKTKIIIPTPVLSEILVGSGKAGPEYLGKLSASAAFRIVSFDVRAAVEVATMTQKAIERGGKRGGSEETWAKIKYDRQIVAIGKVDRVTTIYSDDKHVQALAAEAGIPAIGIAQLPLPPEGLQVHLPLDPPEPRS